MTPAELIAFEEDIAGCFNRGEIRAPVHLSSGNEAQLIEVFRAVAPGDWIATNWRSHYHCLLKGVPPAKLKAEIMAGRSIALCFPSHRIVSSAIVGGIIPIAVGIAMGMKCTGDPGRVHVFMGDMTAMTGIAFECINYATNHMLNMRFIIENNGLSVCTPTIKPWGNTLPAMIDGALEFSRYNYSSKWPHAGAGQRVQF
jgi:pyruvate dehydrogenase E1 component alpha subunit